MNNDQVQVPVTLTREEKDEIDGKATSQGISTPDFVGYCVRAMSFGITYAIRRLPTQGQVGTRKDQE